MTVARNDELRTALQRGLDVLVVVGIFSDRVNAQNPLDGLGDKRKGRNREIQIFV